jgi:hypothetical protein
MAADSTDDIMYGATGGSMGRRPDQPRIVNGVLRNGGQPPNGGRPLTKTPFRRRPRREQAEIAGFIALSIGVVALAQNDLRRRPAGQIRGRKTVWRLLSLNALGALIYLCCGRVPKQQIAASTSSDADRLPPAAG